MASTITYQRLSNYIFNPCKMIYKAKQKNQKKHPSAQASSFKFNLCQWGEVYVPLSPCVTVVSKGLSQAPFCSRNRDWNVDDTRLFHSMNKRLAKMNSTKRFWAVTELPVCTFFFLPHSLSMEDKHSKCLSHKVSEVFKVRDFMACS